MTEVRPGTAASGEEKPVEPPDPTAHFILDEVKAAFKHFDTKEEGHLPATPEMLSPILRSLGFD